MDKASNHRIDLKAVKPNWKDRLRENCLARVRLNRSKVLWDNRLAGVPALKDASNDVSKEFVGSMFQRIVADELQKSKQQRTPGHDSLWEYESPSSMAELGDEEYEALMLAMERALYEDMHENLEGRDAAVVAEDESISAFEDKSLTAVVEQWQDHEHPVTNGARRAEMVELFEHPKNVLLVFVMQIEEASLYKKLIPNGKCQTCLWQAQGRGLLCPICKTRQVQQAQRSIYCGCGRFQIDTQSEQVGLDFLQKRLAEVVEEHTDSGCHSQFDFFVQQRFGIGALYMCCPTCDFFQIVM